MEWGARTPDDKRALWGGAWAVLFSGGADAGAADRAAAPDVLLGRGLKREYELWKADAAGRAKENEVQWGHASRRLRVVEREVAARASAAKAERRARKAWGASEAAIRRDICLRLAHRAAPWREGSATAALVARNLQLMDEIAGSRARLKQLQARPQSAAAAPLHPADPPPAHQQLRAGDAQVPAQRPATAPHAKKKGYPPQLQLQQQQAYASGGGRTSLPPPGRAWAPQGNPRSDDGPGALAPPPPRAFPASERAVWSPAEEVAGVEFEVGAPSAGGKALRAQPQGGLPGAATNAPWVKADEESIEFPNPSVNALQAKAKVQSTEAASFPSASETAACNEATGLSQTDVEVSFARAGAVRPQTYTEAPRRSRPLSALKKHRAAAYDDDNDGDDFYHALPTRALRTPPSQHQLPLGCASSADRLAADSICARPPPPPPPPPLAPVAQPAPLRSRTPLGILATQRAGLFQPGHNVHVPLLQPESGGAPGEFPYGAAARSGPPVRASAEGDPGDDQPKDYIVELTPLLQYEYLVMTKASALETVSNRQQQIREKSPAASGGDGEEEEEESGGDEEPVEGREEWVAEQEGARSVIMTGEEAARRQVHVGFDTSLHWLEQERDAHRSRAVKMEARMREHVLDAPACGDLGSLEAAWRAEIDEAENVACATLLVALAAPRAAEPQARPIFRARSSFRHAPEPAPTSAPPPASWTRRLRRHQVFTFEQEEVINRQFVDDSRAAESRAMRKAFADHVCVTIDTELAALIPLQYKARGVIEHFERENWQKLLLRIELLSTYWRR
ncbi:hypothetical protein DIPPA_30003 [Diplonema papillatum]|nr:hypothetical protein DIPPA_30003 [Diplonema papillatum]